MLRRSQRTKKEKNHFSPSKTNHQRQHITQICPESDTDSDTTNNLNVNVCENNKPNILKDYEICIGCGKDKTHSKTDWIECNTCRCWQHCSCAGINNRDSIKYTTYHIKYSYAFCIIRKENTFERATNITKTVNNQLNNTNIVYPTQQTTVNDTNQSLQQSINITCKPKQKSFKEETEDIFIADTIKEPEKCKTSTDIKKEIYKQKRKGFEYN